MRKNLLALIASLTLLTFFSCAKKEGGSSQPSPSPSTSTSLSEGTPAPAPESNLSAEPPPPAPVLVAPATSPWFTNATSLTITGSCQTGLQLRLTGADSQTVLCDNESFLFSVTKTDDQAYDYFLTQVSPSGRISAPVSLQWVRDTIPPAIPAITEPSANPYASPSNIQLKGSCEADASLELFGAASEKASCSTESFSFLIAKETDGDYLLQVAQTDRAGNASEPSSKNWIRDSSIPSPLTITSPAANPYYSNQDSLVIMGGCANGNTVEISGAATGVIPCTEGSYQFEVNNTENGAHEFNLIQRNLSGASSSVVSVAWTRDTTPPGAPLITSHSGSALTNSSPLLISGTCEAGAQVSVTGTEIQNTTCSAGAFAFSLIASGDGVRHFAVTQTDVAGNNSTATSFDWTLKTSAPATPTISVPGTSPYYSQEASLTVSGQCETNTSILLTGDVTAEQVTGGSLVVSCHENIFGFTIQKNVDGPYNFAFHAVDAAGNTSGASQIQWIRDSVLPSVPTITAPGSSPTYSSSDLRVTGQCENSTTVRLMGAQNQQTQCQNGTYSFNVTENSDGTYDFQITQVDMAGNISPSASLQWVKDSAIPATPTIASPLATPYYSNAGTLLLAGSCVSGYSVSLSGDVTPEQVVGESLTTTCSPLGGFTFEIQKATDGSFDFNVRQTSFSLMNSANATRRWVRDTVPPTVSWISQPANPNLAGVAEFSFSANDLIVRFECRLDDGAFASCTSPLSYSTLSNTNHTLSIRAIDQSGNTSETLSTTWLQQSYSTVALFHFDTATLDSSLFASPNNNTLTNYGTSRGNSRIPGFSQSREFLAANNSYMSANGSSASLNALKPVMTVESMIKLISEIPVGGYSAIISKTGGANNYGWEVGIRNINSAYHLVFSASLDGTTPPTEVSSPNPVTLSTADFVHIAVTWNRGTVGFFANGQSAGTATIGVAGSAQLATSSANLRLGRNEAGASLNAFLEEVRLSQVIRYTGTYTVPKSPFTAD